MQFGLIEADAWIGWKEPLYLIALALSSLYIMGFIWLMVMERRRLGFPQLAYLTRLILTFLIALLVAGGLSLAFEGWYWYIIPFIAVILFIAIPRKYLAFRVAQSAVYLIFCLMMVSRILLGIITESAVFLQLSQREFSHFRTHQYSLNVAISDYGLSFPVLFLFILLGQALGCLSIKRRIFVPGSKSWIAALLNFIMPGWGLVYLGRPMLAMALLVGEMIIFHKAFFCLLFSIDPGPALALSLLPHGLISMGYLVASKKIVRLPKSEPAGG